MLNSNFCILIRSFSKKEIKDFGKFLRQQHARKTIPLSIFEYIRRYAPGFDDPRLDKERAYNQIFPGELYNYRKITDALSDLFLLANQFLLQEKVKTTSWLQQQLLLDIYREKKLQPWVNKTLELLEQQLATDQEDEGLHRKFYYRQLFYDQQLYFNRGGSKVRISSDFLTDGLANLEAFRMFWQLQYYLELEMRRNILNEKADLPKLKALLDEVGQLSHATYPIHHIYRQLFLLMREENDDYDSLIKMMAKEKDRIAPIEQQVMQIYLLNYISRLIRRGQVKYSELAFHIYRSGLASGVLLIDGKLTVTRFMNILDSAIKIGNMPFARQVLALGDEYLDASHREDCLEMGQAMIDFADNELDRAVARIEGNKYDSMDLRIRSRWLLVCLYYDLNAFDKLINHLRAFEVLLRRDQILSEANKKATRNFIRLTRKLYLREAPKDELKTLIQETKPIVNQRWLIKKLGTYRHFSKN